MSTELVGVRVPPFAPAHTERPWRLRCGRLLFSALLLAVAGCAEPEDIVREAATAAAEGDKDAYLACFTARSRSMLHSVWQAAEPINPSAFALRAAASPIQIMETHRLPPSGSGISKALVVVSEGRRMLPLIVHRVGRQWRIDLLDSERMTSGDSSSLSGELKF